MKLKFAKLVDNNISERDLVNIRKLNAYSLKTLQQIAKLRNINANMSKDDIIDALIFSEAIIDEKKYMFDSNNKMHNKINEIKMQPFTVSPYMNKKEHGNINIKQIS